LLSIKAKRRLHRRIHGHLRTVMLRETITLASVSYTVAAGAQRSIALPISKAGMHLLTRARKHVLRVQARATLTGGKTAGREIVLQLRSPSGHRKR